MVIQKRAGPLYMLGLAGVLFATACGGGAPADTGKREGETINDYVEKRDGIGIIYNLKINQGKGEEAYSFRTDDPDLAQSTAYRVKKGDRVKFKEGDITTIEIVQTSQDRVEIPTVDLIAKIYSEDEQREFHSFAIKYGIAKFRAHAYVPGLDGMLEYIVEVPYQTSKELDKIWENLQRTPAFRIRSGAENVDRHYPGVKGKAPVDHPVKAYRDIDGLLHLAVDSDYIDWLTGRDSEVPSRYERPSRTTPTPTPTPTQIPSTPSPTATPTSSPTISPTVTSTPTQTSSPISTPSQTSTPTAVAPPPTPSPTLIPSVTVTPSSTPDASATPKPTDTASPAASPTKDATYTVPNALPRTGG